MHIYRIKASNQKRLSDCSHWTRSAVWLDHLMFLGLRIRLHAARVAFSWTMKGSPTFEEGFNPRRFCLTGSILKTEWSESVSRSASDARYCLAIFCACWFWRYRQPFLQSGGLVRLAKKRGFSTKAVVFRIAPFASQRRPEKQKHHWWGAAETPRDMPKSLSDDLKLYGQGAKEKHLEEAESAVSVWR